MIGIYNYTVILTYMSLASAVTGIVLAFNGHSFSAIICLLVSGLCDMFDGKVARTKKQNSEEASFGIQIDSLADIVAFGILPIAIGVSLGLNKPIFALVYTLYALCALIRLAYFNVLAETNKKKSNQPLKFYTGLPVTSVALILPFLYIFKPLTIHFNTLYIWALVIIALMFVSKIKIKKPTFKTLIIFIVLGVIELILILKSIGII